MWRDVVGISPGQSSECFGALRNWRQWLVVLLSWCTWQLARGWRWCGRSSHQKDAVGGGGGCLVLRPSQEGLQGRRGTMQQAAQGGVGGRQEVLSQWGSIAKAHLISKHSRGVCHPT